ncbi:hypothetical protein PVK06_028471 [Gossypium arboreum]|uniref:ATP synthase F1 complex delta/epsilon subunit N-terminal domain-containing protein n=1 Tax=Gossypium arboreum TaxID=29729 RepID=A0ABR0P400_GOSAR|nr:hypothetical protein PVK06_028471 [Gossypium arboreum]
MFRQASSFLRTRTCKIPTSLNHGAKLYPNWTLPRLHLLSSPLAPQKRFAFDLFVDMVIVPATTGHMGVLPRHVPTIAELKPDVLSVHEVKDCHSTALSLAEFTQKLGSATTDMEKAEAQIGVDVHSALNSGITG